jgi:hypothetical protein
LREGNDMGQWHPVLLRFNQSISVPHPIWHLFLAGMINMISKYTWAGFLFKQVNILDLILRI